MSKGIKYAAMAAALLTITDALQRKADVYGTLNSQDADYRELQQQAAAALALQDDPDVDAAPAPVVLQAMTAEQVEQLIASLGPFMATGEIVTAITEEIEKSDAHIVAAIVQTGQDTVHALLPSGAAPAAEPAAQ